MRGAFSRLSLLNGCTLEPNSITSATSVCAGWGSIGSILRSCIGQHPSLLDDDDQTRLLYHIVTLFDMSPGFRCHSVKGGGCAGRGRVHPLPAHPPPFTEWFLTARRRPA